MFFLENHELVKFLFHVAFNLAISNDAQKDNNLIIENKMTLGCRLLWILKLNS